MDFVLEELDKRNHAQTTEFEQAFYRAFKPLTHNLLIRRLWIWDEENCRLRTRVPYDEQTIFVSRDAEGHIETALALGTQLLTVQSQFYGFSVPCGHENCEALAFFGLGERRMRDTMKFWRACRDIVKARGIQAIYGTCAPGVMPVYHWVGGRVLESREFEGETRLFFTIEL